VPGIGDTATFGGLGNVQTAIIVGNISIRQVLFGGSSILLN
jgi:hypothetical protein